MPGNRAKQLAPFTSILAATDLSRHGREAVLRAGRIARDSGAGLHIVHVLQVAALDKVRHLLAGAPTDLRTRLEGAARFALEELAQAVERDYGVRPSLRCVEGELTQEIEKAADEAAADLVVFGARGISVARHLLLGSTAERLLARSSQSMLVVRLPAEVTYRRALVPVDFSEASLPALRRAQALVPAGAVFALHAYEAPFEGKLRLAGVDDKDLRGYVRAASQEAEHAMASLVARTAGTPRVQSLLLHGHPLAHALDQQEELDCQLVVVGKGSGSRANDFFLGSISRQVLAQCPADVLMSV